MSSSIREICTFTVGDLQCGIDVMRVQEVLLSQPMTPVPLAPPTVEGLINLRGQIVVAVDMRKRFGLAARPDGAPPMNVVVESVDGGLSLLVDRIGDVLPVDAEMFEPPPPNVSGVVAELAHGVYKLADGLLVLLDPDRVCPKTTTTSGRDGGLGSEAASHHDVIH